MRCIPVKEEGSHLLAFKRARQVLSGGGIIGIFPEGRLSDDGELQSAAPGVALLQSLTGVPVVPAYLRGTFDALPRGARFLRRAKLEVRFGAPLRRGEALIEGGKAALEENTETIMKAVSRLAEFSG
jgi:1-acyl-sn-glycerol-3-phosphate acyltransferase